MSTAWAALPAHCAIRPARDDDARVVYSISMDPIVRENSTRSDRFTWEQHLEWWREKRSNGLNAIWMLEVLGAPVGVVRYGKVTRSCPHFSCRPKAEIAISLFPSHHGRGLGYALLAGTMAMACEWLKVDTLVALVLRTNRASRRLFRKAGFKYVGVECRMDKTHARYEWSTS